jgi:ribonuclease Z
MKLDLPGLRLEAVSVAGLETCIQVPSWKLAFDIGRCPPSAPRWPTVLFTHAHLDHMGGVANHCATRSMMGMAPPHYVMPAKNVDAFGALLDAWRRLDGSPLDCTVQGVVAGDEIQLGQGRIARAFQVYHRVPSVGYALIEQRRKLRPELVGRPGREIAEMRKAGESIDVLEEHIELAFCGDTLIDVVDREPMVRQARVLILEATFLDDRVGVEATRGKGHIHLDEIIDRAELFENKHLVLNHASIRYSADEIRATVMYRAMLGCWPRTALL